VALAVLTVYLSTLAPSVGSMDSGELAAVASTLGIAHPTGYPLFTLLGWAFAHLPVDARVIWKLNLFAALLCAAAIFFFYRLFLELLTRPPGTPGGPQGSGPPLPRERAAGATAAAVLAFSTTFWSQALSIEVYSLHLLFLSLLCLLLLAALRAGPEHPSAQLRAWALFAFTLGLSFTNHMTTVLLAPAFLYLALRGGGLARLAGRAPAARTAALLGCFLLGLSVYLYLPLRAAQHPVLNWGDPSTLERLWDHVSAKQFRPWMFSSLQSAVLRFGRFVVRFPGEFGYLPVLLSAVGLADLFRRARVTLVFTLLLFFGCLFYSVNYDIPDADAYFLLAYVAAAIWAAFGARALLRASRTRLHRAAAAVLCAASVLFPLALHYRVVDRSRDFAQEDFARNMLGSLAPGAVILTDEETSFYFTAYYLQWVEGFRPDVVVLGYRALGMPWYIAQTGRSYPALFRNSRPEIEAYLKERARFEADQSAGRAADASAYAGSFVGMVQSLLREGSRSRPVYVSAALPPAYAAGFTVVPEGLALRLFRDGAPHDLPVREFSWRPLRAGAEADGIRAAYAWGYFNQGAYRVVNGDTLTGTRLIQKALAVDPSLPEAAAWLSRLERTR
jgi:hypothetical protein